MIYLNSKRKYLVVATKEELSLPESRRAMDKGYAVIITGVGGVNAVRALCNLPKDVSILNVGFCGSTSFQKGYAAQVGEVRLYHPNCEFTEEVFRISEPGVKCLTAGDFVQGGSLPDNSVCDMELAYICALGFKNIRAVKYVSDGLDYKEYEQVSTL